MTTILTFPKKRITTFFGGCGVHKFYKKVQYKSREILNLR